MGTSIITRASQFLDFMSKVTQWEGFCRYDYGNTESLQIDFTFEPTFVFFDIYINTWTYNSIPNKYTNIVMKQGYSYSLASTNTNSMSAILNGRSLTFRYPGPCHTFIGIAVET